MWCFLDQVWDCLFHVFIGPDGKKKRHICVTENSKESLKFKLDEHYLRLVWNILSIMSIFCQKQNFIKSFYSVLNFGCFLYVMRCVIWYHLFNLKNLKNTHGGVLLFVVTLLHGCFSRFLNCTDHTKSRKTSHMKCSTELKWVKARIEAN